MVSAKGPHIGTDSAAAVAGRVTTTRATARQAPKRRSTSRWIRGGQRSIACRRQCNRTDSPLNPLTPRLIPERPTSPRFLAHIIPPWRPCAYAAFGAGWEAEARPERRSGHAAPGRERRTASALRTLHAARAHRAWRNGRGLLGDHRRQHRR